MTKSDIRVSAPGKVILHGEHAVVYGKTAIAVSLGLRTVLDVKRVNHDVVLSMPDLNKRYCWTVEQLQSLRKLAPFCTKEVAQPASPEVLTVIQQFLEHSGPGTPDNGVISFLYLYLSILPDCPPLSATIASDIPIGAGLGSSAAMSVVFASGLLLYAKRCSIEKMEGSVEENGNLSNMVNGNGNSRLNANENVFNNGNGNILQHGNANGNDIPAQNGELSKKTLGSEIEVSIVEKDLICAWALMSEKIMHGTPSGIDNSVATYGGVVTFCSGSMSPVSDLVGLDILLTNTCVGRNTRQLVSAVKERYTMFPKVLEQIMEAVENLSLAALDTMESCRVKQFSNCTEEFSRLESLVDMNQGLLASLGVSHPSLERVIQITGAHGLHTKLTGAGGGGVAFSLVTPDTDKSKVDQAKKDLEKASFMCYTTSIGGPGVMAWNLS